MSTILHVAQPTIGGVPQMVCDLVAGQHRAGDRVFVACPAEGLLAGRAGEAGAEVVAWESERSPARGVPPEMRALRRVVEDVRPDVVHLHSSKAGLVGRLVVRGRIPTVFQPQAWSFSAVTGPLRIASARWERQGARWAHRIICVNEKKRVEFVGDVPVAKPWYALSDVMVMPSRWEGMALAPLEAMASGRAVVITDVPGARESLPRSDRPALAPVPVDDPVALAAVLAEMLLDHGLRAEAARAGRVHVSANYDISAAVDRIYDVYREARQSVVPDRSVDIR